jgi:nucleoside-diphosphate-sugar epimerase
MMAGSRPTLVTGATGFIGARLVEELARGGSPVRALVRPTSNGDGIRHLGVELIEGDILAPDTLRRAISDCRHVFHLAGHTRNWARDPTTYHEHNVIGTRNVLAAARAANVEKIVLTSSIVTLGPTPPGAIGDETMARVTTRFFTTYEKSKAEAEGEALAMASKGLPVVVVNPTRVFGPGRLSEGNSVTVMIEQRCRGRFPFLLAGGAHVGNYAFVEDVARGHILAMERGRPGERYILGGEDVSLKGLFSLVDRVSATRHLTISLPPTLARAYAGLEERKARWLGLYPRITPGWVETFLHHWAFSSAKAERELGYTRTALADGVRTTHEWLQGGAGRPGDGR